MVSRPSRTAIDVSQNGGSIHRRLGELREDRTRINVGRTERLVSGSLAAARGCRGRAPAQAAASAAASLGGRPDLPGGHRPVSGESGLGRNTARGGRVSRVASVRRGEGIKVEKSITVNRPAEEVYRFWRNLENLPRFMDHLESVTVLDENRSHWVAKARRAPRWSGMRSSTTRSTTS